MGIEQPEEFVKKVDEGWKAQVEKERGASPGESAPAKPPRQPRREGWGPASAQQPPQADFGFFLSSLSMQAMISLGELPHPATNQPQVELEQAKNLIDILGMLQEKTKGNLTPEEQGLLEDVLYELRLKYVQKTESRP